MLKKVASIAAVASLLLASAPALARQMDGAEHPKVKAIMKVMKNHASSSSSSVSSTSVKKDVLKRAMHDAKVSRRGLHNSKKFTPSEACKGTFGNEHAACMQAFNKGGKPQTGWSWSMWSSSSKTSSSSVSSASTSSMSSVSTSSVSSSSTSSVSSASSVSSH